MFGDPGTFALSANNGFLILASFFDNKAVLIYSNMSFNSYSSAMRYSLFVCLHSVHISIPFVRFENRPARRIRLRIVDRGR